MADAELTSVSRNYNTKRLKDQKIENVQKSILALLDKDNNFGLSMLSSGEISFGFGMLWDKFADLHLGFQESLLKEALMDLVDKGILVDGDLDLKVEDKIFSYRRPSKFLQ